MKNTFDYIIVGAGSAGCVLAARLSANRRYQILLLEAGDSDQSWMIKMPSAFTYPMHSHKYNWHYYSDPEPYLNYRQISCPRGKCIGGSSSINGMVYVRGHPYDFDQWQELGCSNWGYSHCLPYFMRAEHWMGEPSAYHGESGNLFVCAGNNMRFNPLYQTFIQAALEAGYSYTADYNGFKQEGFGPMFMTVEHGRRCSAARAYLKNASDYPNLKIVKNCLVVKILFRQKVASGVECVVNGSKMLFYAQREIILSAGAIASPIILQRSGVGSVQLLKSYQIKVVHDLIGVGENLQDHLEIYFQYQCKRPISLNGSLNPFSKLAIFLRWLLFKTGLGATNHYEAGGFIRSSAAVKWPDIQYHFLPAAINYDGSHPFKGHGFQVHVGPTKPYSRGRVHLTGTKLEDLPSILFNYLQNDKDLETWLRCIRLTREIIAQPAFDDFRGTVIQPLDSLINASDIIEWLHDHVESAYHPCGTCKMGDVNDPSAVVNTEGEVYGVSHLRVVDASIFPTITNGNINAPTIMVAEKIAAKILKEKPLELYLPTWVEYKLESRELC